MVEHLTVNQMVVSSSLSDGVLNLEIFLQKVITYLTYYKIMSKDSKKVITVTGLIEPEDMGLTLSHVHLLIDFTLMYHGEKDSKGNPKKIPIKMENLGSILYDPYTNFDNLLTNSEELGIIEVEKFKESGGQTIVDCTSLGIMRSPNSLKKISSKTDINIICGSGYYVQKSHPSNMNEKKEKDIANEIIRDIQEGIPGTEIRSGFIGEIGNTYPWHDNEKKVCRGAALAQLETGAALSIHPGRNREAPIEILRLLKEQDTTMNKVIMCHIDRTINKIEDLRDISKFDCYIELDLFGSEGFYPLSDFPMTNDNGRILLIKELIKEGLLDRILISHDICWKTRWSMFGGYGLNHIPKNIVPRLIKNGITQEQINQILIDNPRRVFTIE